MIHGISIFSIPMIIPTHIKQQINGVSKQEAEKEWNILKEALDDIFYQKASGMNYRKLYEYFFKTFKKKKVSLGN
jgi:uncharacterized membrane-anchored protein